MIDTSPYSYESNNYGNKDMHVTYNVKLGGINHSDTFNTSYKPNLSMEEINQLIKDELEISEMVCKVQIEQITFVNPSRRNRYLDA